MSTLVIRYSSLGDVVLAGSVTGGCAPVLFRTKAAWAPVAARLPGVERVLVLGEDPIPRGIERVIDLQVSPRSIKETLGLPVRRVRRFDLRRRLRVWLKQGAAPPSVIQRYAEAAGVHPAALPWLDVKGPGDAILLCPGAAWPTKRWPAERWIALGERLPGPLLLLGSLDEGALLRQIASAIGPRAEVIAEQGFRRSFEALGRGRLAIAGDTGLLHLAAAAGIPVVGLFGPTTSQDGFWTHPGRAVELELACRPCSRHGGIHCPVGDHRCMVDISVEAVLSVVRELA